MAKSDELLTASSSGVAESIRLPTLKKQSIFLNWKFRMHLFLEQKGVVEVLQVRLKKKVKKRDDYKIKDSEAKLWIVQSVDDELLDVVRNCTTAQQMIMKLEAQFQRKTAFSKYDLKKQLLTMRLETSERLQTHFKKFDQLISELEAIGCRLDESDKVCHLLLTLPEEYKVINTSFDEMLSIAESGQLLELVKTQLLESEIRLKQKLTNDSNIENKNLCSLEVPNINEVRSSLFQTEKMVKLHNSRSPSPVSVGPSARSEQHPRQTSLEAISSSGSCGGFQFDEPLLFSHVGENDFNSPENAVEDCDNSLLFIKVEPDTEILDCKVTQQNIADTLWCRTAEEMQKHKQKHIAAPQETKMEHTKSPQSNSQINYSVTMQTSLHSVTSDTNPVQQLGIINGVFVTETSGSNTHILPESTPYSYDLSMSSNHTKTHTALASNVTHIEADHRRKHDEVPVSQPTLDPNSIKVAEGQPVTQVPFMCHICYNIFLTKSTLDFHIKDAHREIEMEVLGDLYQSKKKIACQYCAKGFARICDKVRHELSHTKEKKKINCEICAKSFRFKYLLQRHTIRMHSRNKPFVCTFCDSCFGSASVMRYHIKRAHNPDKFECNECGQIIKTKQNLITHIQLVHLNTIPKFKCNECGTVIKRRRDLVYHIKSVHLNAKTRPFKCDVCKKGFTGNKALNRHKILHRQENSS